MIVEIPQLEYMCPACGNYFYNSGVRSFSIFGSIRYSDGVRKTDFDPFRVSQCPKCMQYVANEHLFRLPFPVPVDFGLEERERRRRYTVKNDENYGRVDCFNGGNRKAIVEKIIAQGLYFPITVSEKSRRSNKLFLYRELWHEYNMHRDEIDDAVYCNVCRELIEMLADSSGERFRLTLAELYRNVGEFEKCLAILDELNLEKERRDAVERIRSEAMKKNKLTVVIEDTREGASYFG